LDQYRSAADAAEEAGDSLALTTATVRTGDLHFLLNEYHQAIQVYEHALTICRPNGDRRSEGEILNDIAVNSLALLDTETARAQFSRAVEIFREIDVPQGLAIAQSNGGAVELQTANWDAAIADYLAALKVMRGLGDPRLEAYTMASLAVAYASLGDRQVALGFFRKALDNFDRVRDQSASGITLSSMSRIYLALDQWQPALDCARRGLEALLKHGDRRAQAEARYDLGLVYAHTPRLLGLAETQFRLAAIGYETAGDRRGQAAAYQSLGELQIQWKHYDAALEMLRRALDIRRRVGSWDGVASTLYAIALAERYKGRLDEARSAAEESTQIAMDLRVRIAADRLRTIYRANREDYFRLYLSILLELHRLNPSAGFDRLAFEASERMRAQTLREHLGQNTPIADPDVPAEILQRRKQAQDQLNLRAGRLAAIYERPSNSTAEQTARKAFDEARTEFDVAESAFEAVHRRNAPAVQTNLDQVRSEILDSQTVLLEYSLLEQDVALWIVTRDDARLVVLHNRSAVEAAARTAGDWLRQPHPPAELAAERSEGLQALRFLNRYLLPDVIRTGHKRLVIVADGLIHQVPFGALPEQPTGPYRPLILDHEVVYLPSAHLVASIRKRTLLEKEAPAGIAVFADPITSSADSRLPAGFQGKFAFERPSLVFARAEGEVVLETWHSGRRLRAFDFDANLETAIQAIESGYAVLHFAAHGIASRSEPELAGILLSEAYRPGRPRDGLLTVQRLASLNLSARLVVMGTCESDAGPELAGEGVMSLTRALLYSGAASVVTALWKVDDAATVRLMTYFYQATVLEGLPAAAALRKAQIRLWESDGWGDPYLWAAFTAHGEWREAALSK
jgi:CHAT domain-containing protein